MEFDPGLLLNAIVSGLLLGGFYALATSGLTIAFGMLDVVNIAHPTFIVLGAFATFALNQATGLDPILCCVILLPVFFLIGRGFYDVYYRFFERRGDAAIQGLAFFFGVMFVVEVSLSLIFGPNHQHVETPYAWTNLGLGPIDLPVRMLIPCAMAAVGIGAVSLFFRTTFIGRAVAAVGQDEGALRLVAIDPLKIKRLAFGLSLLLAGLAGGGLLVIQPVDPWGGHTFIGRVFAICILGGLASMRGSWMAALLFGVIENVTATFIGPSWSPAVAFGLLLVTLAVRPQGLFAR